MFIKFLQINKNCLIRYKNILCILYIMSIKLQGIVSLFVALIIILAVNPKVVNNIYGSILGRLFLISIVIFFAMNNTTLGSLVALVIITALNQFGSFVEGFEQPTNVSDDKVSENVDTNSRQLGLTSSSNDTSNKKISELKQQIAEGTAGIDKEDIKIAIMSKDSKEFPVDPNMNSSSEVSPSSSGMLNPSSSTLEGFSSYAMAY